MSAHPRLSFHTRGDRASHNGSYIIINQAYVQYLEPRGKELNSYVSTIVPILFVHGGGLTGSYWETTPDRRPGWAMLACRPPYCRHVYIVDAVDSGRSQRCPDHQCEGGNTGYEHRTAAQIRERFRIRASDDDVTEGQFPPGSQPFDALVGAQAARRRGRGQDAVEMRGLNDVLAEIGPCHVIAHSNGAKVLLSTLSAYGAARENVRKAVLVEPGPWPDASKKLDKVDLPETLIVWGDGLDGHDLWVPAFHQWQSISDVLEVWSLPEMGISGNSHFPMSDLNSDLVGHKILDWLQG